MQIEIENQWDIASFVDLKVRNQQSINKASSKSKERTSNQWDRQSAGHSSSQPNNQSINQSISRHATAPYLFGGRVQTSQVK